MPKRSNFYVEIYRPVMRPTGVKGDTALCYARAHAAVGFDRDNLHPSMIALFEVKEVANRAEAIARVCERAAGFPSDEVRLIIGGGHAGPLPPLE